MPVVGDVFGLNSVYEKQVTNAESNNFESWPESATYGYFGGGYASTHHDDLEKLDFSNETVKVITYLYEAPSEGGGAMAVTSNNSYGYFAGGIVSPSYPPVTRNRVVRLDFSNETTSYPGKNLPTPNRGLGGVSGSLYGYYGGGFDGTNTVSTITRLDFSSETFSAPGNNLPTIYFYASSGDKISTPSGGYFNINSTLVRLNFSDETMSLPGKNLPPTQHEAGVSDKKYYGYFFGGGSNITRIDLSNESLSDPGSNFPPTQHATGEGAATSSNEYGYIIGGYNSCRISRINYSTETMSFPGKNSSKQRYKTAAVSGGASVYRNARGFGTYGYFGGGYTGTPAAPPFDKSFVFRFDFSTESFTPVGTLTSNRYDAAGFSSKNDGYFLGGFFLPGTNYTNSANKISFSNETMSTATSVGTSRGRSIGLSSKYCGYLVGGFSFPNPVSNNVNKFDYSSGSRNDLGNILPSSIDNSTGVDSGSYGYMTLPFSCSINRLDFSNETVNNPGNNLPYTTTTAAGISHTLYGYFAGGSVPAGDPATYRNTISRIDFSNETISLPGKNLLQSKREISTTQSASYGYCVGGEIPKYPPPLLSDEISTISRIDFSTENVTDIATAFPQNVRSSVGVSNHNKYNLYS